MELSELEKKYVIRDKPLFYKTGSVLAGVILLFFINSFVGLNLNLVWIALLGAVIILILTDVRDITSVLESIELGTLLFFAGLFVLMHCLRELGVMYFISELIADLIAKVPEGIL